MSEAGSTPLTASRRAAELVAAAVMVRETTAEIHAAAAVLKRRAELAQREAERAQAAACRARDEWRRRQQRASSWSVDGVKRPGQEDPALVLSSA